MKGLAPILILSLCIWACKSRKPNDSAAKTYPSGLKIEYGYNLGTTHSDALFKRHFYVHATANITNDSTVPIHLQFALAKEYEFPAFCEDDTYKAFILPEELTPDTATLYNNIVNGPHAFLDAPLSLPDGFQKTLLPGDFCVVTIGILIAEPANCAAVPRAVFSFDNQEQYRTCDRLENPAVSSSPPLEIGVKLEYYKNRKFLPPEDHCAIIPFGQISYPAPE